MAELEKRIAAFNGGKEDEEYTSLEKLLADHKTSLDSIKTNGNDRLAKLRGESIHAVLRSTIMLRLAAVSQSTRVKAEVKEEPGTDKNGNEVKKLKVGGNLNDEDDQEAVERAIFMSRVDLQKNLPPNIPPTYTVLDSESSDDECQIVYENV